MKEFKVGDRVVSERGIGMIFELDGNSGMGLPLGVVYESGIKEWYSLTTQTIKHHDDDKEFPRLMEVRNKFDTEWRQRICLCIHNGMAVCVVKLEQLKSSLSGYSITQWGEYREIQEPEVIELTIDQIAEKFGTTPELIKIKK